MPVKNIAEPTGDGIERRRAVVVGIGHFVDGQPLPFSASDAHKVDEVLLARGFEVTLLHDGPGGARRRTITAAKVLDAVRGAVAASDEDDLVLVYLACHGVRVADRPFLTMADTPAGEATWRDGHLTRGLRLADLFAALRGRTRWVSVFLDVCAMGLGIDAELGASMQHVEDRAGGFALLSGSRADGKSYDSDDGAVFTRYLVDGLAGAAIEPDGSVRFSRLARHVQRGVAAWVQSAEGQNKAKKQAAVMRLEVADVPVIPANPFVEFQPKLAAKITCAAWSPDGRRIATTSEDFTLRLWDPATGRQVLGAMEHLFVEGEQTLHGYLGGVAFAPDGQVVASCGNEGTVRTWQVAGANEVTPIPPGVGAICTKVAWHPKGQLLVAGAENGIHVYAADSIKRLTHVRTLHGHVGFAWCVAFAPDGELVSGGKDGTVRCWDVATGACMRQWQVEGPVWAVAISPDGKHVVTGGADEPAGPTLVNEVRSWDRKTGKLVRRYAGHGGGVTSIAYTATGDRIATTSYDGHARVWRVADGRKLHDVSVVVDERAHRPEAYAAVFSPDGTQLFVGYADGRGRLYKVA